MISTKGFAAYNATSALVPFSFQRRAVGSSDVHMQILFCGVCHSDIHQVRDEWGGSIYPMVPGHEIVGRVINVGKSVRKFQAGDVAAVGCMVDSCRECANCKQGLEQYCKNGSVATYNSYERDKKTPTYGGYSKEIVVHEDFVLKVSDSLSLPGVAPLLCAGITTYSPLRHWRVGKGHKVGVLGLGGLGHMAVKFAAAFGAEVTMLSTSSSKEADARRLGAHKFMLTTNKEQVKSVRGSFDFIIDTVSAAHDHSMFLKMLNTNGTLICLGIPPSAATISESLLIGNRRSVAGSLIGGIAETQEMLDFCADYNIVSDIEIIGIEDIHIAYERMIKGDVRYRFVIDLATLE